MRIQASRPSPLVVLALLITTGCNPPPQEAEASGVDTAPTPDSELRTQLERASAETDDLKARLDAYADFDARMLEATNAEAEAARVTARLNARIEELEETTRMQAQRLSEDRHAAAEVSGNRRQETNAVLAGAHRELAESENQIMALQARVLSLREELADSKLRFDEQVAMTEDEMARREAELGELSP